MNVTLISWYFPSFIGGAEKSILSELKKYKNKGHNCQVISFDEYYKKGEFNIEGIKGINIPLKHNVSRYLTIMLKKSFIIKQINKNLKKSNLILTQSFMAPYVAKIAKNKNIPYNYYLRDENNLNEFYNYEKGFRYFLKILKDMFEFIPKKYYSKNNVFALKNASKVISNSKFIQQLLFKKYKIKSSIIYPEVDYSKLNKKLMEKNPKYITLIGGGNAMKGYDIVLKIAKKLPNEKFLIVGQYKKIKISKNITFMPMQKDIMKVYSKTKILLVPSRWKEAFGRVVLEAQYLGIPVITSNQGGLPEANKNKNLIIEDLENTPIWIKKIQDVINK
ncbi:MAG: glycosyltransferase family 4 protein [Candidatus Woesearchaeota archaeon]